MTVDGSLIRDAEFGVSTMPRISTDNPIQDETGP